MEEFLSEYDNKDNNVYDNGNSYDSQHTAFHIICDKNYVRVNSSKKEKSCKTHITKLDSKGKEKK